MMHVASVVKMHSPLKQVHLDAASASTTGEIVVRRLLHFPDMDGGCSKCSLMHIPGHLILLGKNIFKNEKIDSNVKKPKKRM